MRLPKDKSFAGFNALQVRSLLRTLGRGTVTRHHLECTFQLPKAGAQELIDLLVGEGLLVAADPGGFELTIAGAAFAQASAAPPLHRRTVERRLRELVGRMVEINAKSEFLVGIEEAYVYGSYLSAAERLGDLDQFELLPEGSRTLHGARPAGRSRERPSLRLLLGGALLARDAGQALFETALSRVQHPPR
jgi:hypothetical protein